MKNSIFVSNQQKTQTKQNNDKEGQQDWLIKTTLFSSLNRKPLCPTLLNHFYTFPLPKFLLKRILTRDHDV